MKEALGLLETTGLTPAMVSIDTMTKTAAVQVLQVELNDLCGVCVKITGATSDVQMAIEAGQRCAERMGGAPVASVLPRASSSAIPVILSSPEYSPLIQQNVVMESDQNMHQENSTALGFIETQGFTAVFEAIDTACKAASVEVLGKEKLGGGYVTVVIRGQLSAVTAAVDSGRQKVEGLGKLIAAHVIARPSEAVLKLLPKL